MKTTAAADMHGIALIGEGTTLEKTLTKAMGSALSKSFNKKGSEKKKLHKAETLHEENDLHVLTNL